MDKIIYYVYYRLDGSIVSISPTLEDSIHPFVQIDEAGGRIFIDGTCSIHDFYVDPSVDYPIVKRNVETTVPISSLDFLPIVKDHTLSSKVRITPNNVTFIFDPINKELGKILFGQKHPLVIWITREDLPDFFIEEIIVDPTQLLLMEQVIVPRQYSDCNISVYSNYIMQHFCLEIINAS